jgi:riboflavin kinase/FMN adenylyltransferase
MRIVDWPELAGLRGTIEAVALTIGVFDSLHLGHQELIRAVVQNGCGALPAVCTFKTTPAEILGSRRHPGSILSFSQKMSKLQTLGVALVVLIDFSGEISKLTGRRFLDLLASRLDLRKLVVGYNFHMGRGRDTGVGELRAMLAGSEIDLEVVPPTLYQDEVVSSSRIREAVLQGRFRAVRAMLKDDFRLDLKDAAVLREGEITKIRRSEIKQVLPKNGDYEVLFHSGGRDYPGRLSIGDDEISWQKTFPDMETEIRFRN